MIEPKEMHSQSNPFDEDVVWVYYGVFIWKGKEYESKHKPMITIGEYDRVQELLGRKGKPRNKTYSFPFTGIIKCGCCGGMITAEIKKKFNHKMQRTKEYTFYHCTKRKKGIRCNQKHYMSGLELEKQIYDILGKYTIHPQFREWGLELLKEENGKEIEDSNMILENLRKQLTDTEKKQQRLTEFLLSETIDEETFSTKKEEYRSEIIKLRTRIKENEQRSDNWIEKLEDAFNFLTYAREEFVNGGMEKKKEILLYLGLNLIKTSLLRQKMN